MNLIISNLASIIFFSIIFFLFPIKMNSRKKLLIIFFSVSCNLLWAITHSIFSGWFSAVIVLLFIICITVLVGPKVQWLEKTTSNKQKLTSIQKELPIPLFSFDVLKENAMNASNLDFPASKNILSINREDLEMDMEMKTFTIKETAASIETNQAVDITSQDHMLRLDEPEQQNEVPPIYHRGMEMNAGSNQLLEEKQIEDDFNEDIQQIFKKRYKLLVDKDLLEISNSQNDKENLSAAINADFLKTEDYLSDSQEDLQLLYKSIKKDRER